MLLRMRTAARARPEMPKNFDIDSEERLYAWRAATLTLTLTVVCSF